MVMDENYFLDVFVKQVHESRTVPADAFFVVVAPVQTDDGRTKTHFVMVPPSAGTDEMSVEAVRQTLEKISTSGEVWSRLLGAQLNWEEQNAGN